MKPVHTHKHRRKSLNTKRFIFIIITERAKLLYAKLAIQVFVIYRLSGAHAKQHETNLSFYYIGILDKTEKDTRKKETQQKPVEIFSIFFF
jgi:hypothetical protein